VKGLIAEHLEQLADEVIVPTFPRSSGSLNIGRMGGGAEAVERVLEGDRFLKAVKGVWEDHTGSMRKLKDVLKYMASHHLVSTDTTLGLTLQDKVYTASAGVPHIYDVGLTLFLVHIIRSAKHPIHTHLIATLLSQVQLERDGETINRSTVRECVDVLLRLHVPAREGGGTVYLADFEPEFLRRSGEYYRLEGDAMLERGDAGAYLRNVSC